MTPFISGTFSKVLRVAAGLAVVGVPLTLGSVILGQKSSRTEFKPPKLVFMSPKEDIEIGKQGSTDVEKELNLIQTPRVTSYITALGKQLTSYAPGEKYPYQFKVVDDKQINAFAMPGGFIYVNRGIFETADNEGQLAGVVAHEISHVALRHSASQISKALATQTGLSILGSLLGGNKGGDLLSKVGMKGMDLLLLKNSREAETQADLLGTQILYDGGYETKAMSQFFEKLNAIDKGGSQFLSDHPNPENRVESVNKEIAKLGGSRPNPKSDTAEFQAIKSMVKAMPEAKPKPKPGDKPAAAPGSAPAPAANAPEAPSSRYVQAQIGDVRLSYPENWKATGRTGDVTLAPPGGLVANGLIHGMIVATFTPAVTRGRRLTLEDATNQLIANLQRSNSQLKISGTAARSIRLGGQTALSVELANQSPNGSREIDVALTILRPNGVLDYFVAVAPQKDFPQYQETFNKILATVQFR